MTSTPNDERTDAYLWDPAAPADPDVAAVEQQARALRFDPASTPLVWPTAIRAKRSRWLIGLAAAAVVVLLAGAALAGWRWSWPAGRAWRVDQASGASHLAVGSPLEISDSGGARVLVARIGTMQLEPGSRITLQSTQGSRHRIALERGTAHVRLWAPPGSVAVRTPTGEVIDLGCEFDLTVSADASLVRVQSGWVQLENTIDEVLIPAGAWSEMRAGQVPGVPLFLDAAPGFTAAVRELEAGRGDPERHTQRIVAEARARDVLTLLLLIERRTPGLDRFAARAAELAPPPSDVTVSGIVRGDRDALWRWRGTLPLPPVKGWIRNWRDGLPAWLVGSAR